MIKENITYGAIILKDWTLNPVSGQNVLSVVGKLKLLTAKEDFSFVPKSSESNWAIRVGSEDKFLIILGCQIRAVYSDPGLLGNHVNTWVIT